MRGPLREFCRLAREIGALGLVLEQSERVLGPGALVEIRDAVTRLADAAERLGVAQRATHTVRPVAIFIRRKGADAEGKPTVRLRPLR